MSKEKNKLVLYCKISCKYQPTKTKHKHLGTEYLEDDEIWYMYFEAVK